MEPSPGPRLTSIKPPITASRRFCYFPPVAHGRQWKSTWKSHTGVQFECLGQEEQAVPGSVGQTKPATSEVTPTAHCGQ
jgi:hypothetical protein